MVPIQFDPVLILDGRTASLGELAPWIHAVTVAIIEQVTAGQVTHDVSVDPDWLEL